jgi:hypothetical protein
MSPSPRHDERVELRVPTIDLEYWRAAAEEAGLTLSDWIRRACFNALPDDKQLMVYRRELAEKRGATFQVLSDDGTGRVDGGRFHVVRGRTRRKGT